MTDRDVAAHSDPAVLWEPPPDIRERSQMGRWLGWLDADRGLVFNDYDAAWRWSIENVGAFWSSIWQFYDVDSSSAGSDALKQTGMPGAEWFPAARINYAHHALRLGGRQGSDVVVIGRSQTRERVALTVDELRDAVGRAQAGLARLGIGEGDRVVAYLPNVPEALIAFLATVGLGAIWSSCSPEFGVRSVIDRFSQVEPKLLIGIDGYRYGDEVIDRRDDMAAIRAALPSLSATVMLPYLDGDYRLEGALPWAQLLAGDERAEPRPVTFDHPLSIMYSSGTTGLPKAIVHGHGGILLEHLKAIGLHSDIGPSDRFFWYTTTSWMMWNYVVSGLLTGSTIVLFDGDPASPDLAALWQLAADERCSYFGASAPFLMACRKASMDPGRDHDLSSLRGLGSTGSALPTEGFDWVAGTLGRGVQLGSLSGGTDLCTGFLGPSPLVPVWAGEISCRMLGARVEAFDDAGRSLLGERGELVITAPMPSMPLGFWGDPDGSRFRASYFERYPGVWHHGDWLTITERGSCIVSGRSDATLNRGGVRLGTADFYAVVEDLPEVADSLVVHLDDDRGGARRAVVVRRGGRWGRA